MIPVKFAVIFSDRNRPGQQQRSRRIFSAAMSKANVLKIVICKHFCYNFVDLSTPKFRNSIYFTTDSLENTDTIGFSRECSVC